MDHLSSIDQAVDYTHDVGVREPFFDSDAIHDVSFYEVENPVADNFISSFMQFTQNDGQVVLDEMTDDDQIMVNSIRRYENSPPKHFKVDQYEIYSRPLTREELLHSNGMLLVPYVDPMTGRPDTKLRHASYQQPQYQHRLSADERYSTQY